MPVKILPRKIKDNQGNRMAINVMAVMFERSEKRVLKDANSLKDVKTLKKLLLKSAPLKVTTFYALSTSG
jgi:hypothetical protein